MPTTAGKKDGVLAVRDGRDLKVGMRLGQRVIAGAVAERVLFAQRLARPCRAKAKRRRVNVAFDDEVGVGQNGFQFGQNVFKPRTPRRNEFNSALKVRGAESPTDNSSRQSRASKCRLG